MPLNNALPIPTKLHRRIAPPNTVLLSLGVAMLAVIWLLSPVSVAPNRIVPGTSYHLLDAIGWFGALLISLLISALCVLALRTTQAYYWAMLALVVVMLLLMPFGFIVASHWLVNPELPQARVSVGAASWSLLFILLLCLVELRLRLGLSRLSTTLLLSFVGVIWWLCTSSWLQDLALVQEFQARDQQFWRATRQHLQLVSTAVGVSVVAGLLLAMLMRRYTKLQKITFSLLNFLQTIPSIALFGLLLAPLAWAAANIPFLAKLGVSGIGTAPALIALIAYSLLPMVRNTYTALEEVSSDTLEAAKAMGMRSSQRFWQVRLPLALPVVLEGLRITTVQAVGLTAVAALIGAGGLGTFIFQGLGQAAMDMVLLGALPILLLALIVDAGIGALAEALRPGGHE
ncbi:ABC transporter permease [Halomonas sp. 7T]|uniref:ABC transporter permease n=1 Tax=Halomonas sp. 7T TaxID=2893469 RepID=UPI0021DB46CB|nr:ABC transporter permease [Halomonas sp. 7T]UXZ55701.1 ABC transporter permease [Halomonas sp. 7T]